MLPTHRMSKGQASNTDTPKTTQDPFRVKDKTAHHRDHLVGKETLLSNLGQVTQDNMFGVSPFSPEEDKHLRFGQGKANKGRTQAVPAQEDLHSHALSQQR